MPELPEVETVRLGLLPALQNKKIHHFILNRPNLRFDFPQGLQEIAQGATVIDIARRGKFLLLYLDNNKVIISHLGMSGSYRIEPFETSKIAQFSPLRYYAPGNSKAHDHIIIQTEENTIIYNDPRRFGYVDFVNSEAVSQWPTFRTMGTEPLSDEFNEDYLKSKLSGRKSSIKSALLDQKIVAGLGNIYVCEALFKSHISPLRQSNSVKEKQELKRLIAAIKQVLTDAIHVGGSSISDHKQVDGAMGYFQHNFKVYDRENQPCCTPDCSGEIKRIVQQGRSSFYCQICQH